MPPQLLRFSTLLAATAVASAAGSLPARAADPQPTCIRYVDPVAGHDGALGSLTTPWKTIDRALNGNPPVSSGDTVVLLPGVYSFSTNGEVMPIRMRDGVSLQGTNALNTILDGQGATVIDFTPFAPGEDFNNSLVDGVTITNGAAGVRFRSEFDPVRPTIANCFIVKNEIGVQVTTICDLDEPIDGYVDFQFCLVNDTIADNMIGILDEGIPFDDCDPEGTVNGEASPCIVNCLVYPNSCSDLQGVDGDDITNTVFCTFDMAAFNCPALFPNASVIRPDRPIPGTAINVCGLSRTDIFLIPARWDYRLRPPSIFVDGGTTILAVANGTVGRRNFPCGQDIFDVDCEGYHNRRLAGGVPDIGADEQGQLIIAGFAAKTTDFTPAHATVFMLMTPNPALPGALFAETYFGSGPLGYTYNDPLSVPGARPKGTTAPTATPNGAMVVNPNLLLPGFPQTFAMPPVGTALTFSQTSTTPVRRNMQVLPKNGAGSQTTLSNLQSFMIQP